MRASTLTLFLLFATPLLGHKESSRRRIRDGTEHFFRGKLFLHNTQETLLEDAVNNAEAVGTPSKVLTLWYNQTLDHFTPADTRTWKQRYYVNDEFYKPGGPVFLQIGGEGEAKDIWMTNGAWVDYAKKLNALLFQLEHRYYGKSHPTPDLSLDNLRFLSSQQALADLAQFQEAMTEQYNLTGKWVAFGGSYPGSLAAWYRLKYPHLVYASVSSSAPLLAQINFVDYLAVVRDSIAATNPACNDQIKKAVHSAEGLLRRRTGWWMIRKTFKLCDDFDGTNQKDVASLFETLAGNFMDIVQYNEDNRAFSGSKTANITIKTLCDIMVNESDPDTSAFERYGKVNDLMLAATSRNCTDFKYLKSVKDMQQTSWDSSAADGERQWTYQTCNEFGFFQSSDLADQPFGQEFPLKYSIRLCQDVYGQQYNQSFIENAIKWSNTYYGARDLPVTRVIFVNGSIDPWHALGITSSNQTNSENKVIFINAGAHCSNMYPSSPNDSPALKAARQEIFQTLSQWLEQ